MAQPTGERPAPALRNPETDDFPTGPDIGELLPGFSLPDQEGRMVDFHEARGAGGALLVFIRATSW